MGPGWGKAGILLREYVTGWEAMIDAVEIYAPYINAPYMHHIYDQVFHADVSDLPDERLASYDLVLMVDVLEHLEKIDGMALLNRIPGHMVISTPELFFQNPEHETIPSEMHRSLWSAEDFGNRIESNQSAQGGIIVRLSKLGVLDASRS